MELGSTNPESLIISNVRYTPSELLVSFSLSTCPNLRKLRCDLGFAYYSLLIQIVAVIDICTLDKILIWKNITLKDVREWQSCISFRKYRRHSLQY